MEKRLIYINPDRLEQPDRKVPYLARWHGLHMICREWEIAPQIYSMDVDILRSAKDIDEDLRRRAIENFDALSREEQNKFRQEHLSKARPAERATTMTFAGWCDLSKDKIESIAVARPDEVVEPYQKIFQRAYVVIVEGDGDTHGNIAHIEDDTPAVYRFGQDRRFDEYLNIYLMARRGVVSRLLREIERRRDPCQIEMLVSAYLHEWDVQAMAAEPYHSRDFTIGRGKARSAALQWVSVRKRKPSEAEIDAEADRMLDDDPPLAAPPRVDLPASAPTTDPALARAVRSVTWALWVLILVSVLGLFIPPR